LLFQQRQLHSQSGRKRKVPHARLITAAPHKTLLVESQKKKMEADEKSSKEAKNST